MSESDSSESDELSRPADTMRERAEEPAVYLWLLITANRWTIVILTLIASYLVLLLFQALGPSSVQRLIETDAIETVFGSIIIATVTSVTLVLTVAQLVLSQEIGPLGEHRQNMQNSIDFREKVEEISDTDVSPVEPSRFLQTLVRMADLQTDRLLETIAEAPHSDELEEIATYANGITEHSEKVREDLKNAEFGTFQTLLPVLNYNYSWKIAVGRTLRHRYADSLSDEADDAFSDLIEALHLFGPAREHFKTLYFQWDVVNVSREMLYSAMPTLMISAYMMLVFDPARLSGTIFSYDTAYLFVSGAYVISLLPFAVLLAYLLRLLTVAKRTLATGPFILREADQLGQIRYED